MSKIDYSKTYNKSYYDDYSNGAGYENNKLWEYMFSNIADIIIQKYNPKTVLDIGCAFGYLVHAFRKKGVESYGIDVSEYAINHADESVKPYLKNRLLQLVQLGKRNILIVAPSFVTDCLETIEENSVQNYQTFRENGGNTLDVVPSLNDDANFATQVDEGYRQIARRYDIPIVDASASELEVLDRVLDAILCQLRCVNK